jgi:hypothetical protein
MLSLPGLALGVLASIAGMSGMGWSVGTGLLVMGGAWAIAFFGPLAVSTLGGRVAQQIHKPSGRSTPSAREYSHAESLVARGLYQEAIDAGGLGARRPDCPTICVASSSSKLETAKMPFPGRFR